MSEPTTRPYTIVVGVSATSKSPEALRWAAAQAGRQAGRVVAVRAWQPIPPQTGARGAPGVVTRDLAAEEAAASEELAADVAAVLGPDHGVATKLVHATRKQALLAEAQGADLLVVDAPSRTDLSNPPWFVDRLLRQAPCPVIVMPSRTPDLRDTAVAQAARTVIERVAQAAATAGRPGIRPPPHGRPDE